MPYYRLLTLVLALVIFTNVAIADVPLLVSYQGRLTNAANQPLPNGSVVSVVFSIYVIPAGGVAIWSETQNVQTTQNGQFTVLLGQVQPLTQLAFSGPDRFLAIKIGADPEMSPRVRLVSAPYSFRVGTVDGASGGQIFGNLGLGTSFPEQPLHVLKGSSGNTDADASSIAVFEDDANAYLTLLTPSFAERGIIFGDNLNNVDAGIIYNGANNRMDLRTNGNASRISIDSDGNVGVGTATPAARMHIASGDLFIGSVPSPLSVSQNLYIENTGGSTQNTFRFDGFSNDLYIVSRSDPGAFFGSGIRFRTAAAGAGELDRVSITPAGLVGVGTMEPEQPLHVFKGSAGSVSADGNSVAVFENSTNAYLTILAPEASERGLIFGDNLNNVDASVMYSGGANRLEFRVQNNQTRLVIDNGGQIGIGMLNPDYELDVNGAIRCNNKMIAPEIQLSGSAFVNGLTRTGTLEITGGADLAEPFEVSGSTELPEGTVVVIDELHPGKLKISDQAYDTRIAGVVSGAGGINPGLTLKQAELLDSGQSVALTGRVYVRASATNGAIKPGDLLTSSDIPGLAMKATDRERSFGAVIGKAMTGLENGNGLVLLLVNLH